MRSFFEFRRRRRSAPTGAGAIGDVDHSGRRPVRGTGTPVTSSDQNTTDRYSATGDRLRAISDPVLDPGISCHGS
jgi:hypothetical protein